MFISFLNFVNRKLFQQLRIYKTFARANTFNKCFLAKHKLNWAALFQSFSLNLELKSTFIKEKQNLIIRKAGIEIEIPGNSNAVMIREILAAMASL